MKSLFISGYLSKTARSSDHISARNLRTQLETIAKVNNGNLANFEVLPGGIVVATFSTEELNRNASEVYKKFSGVELKEIDEYQLDFERNRAMESVASQREETREKNRQKSAKTE